MSLVDPGFADLGTAVVGDILDLLGRQRQFLSPEIRSLKPDTVVLGRAMPVLVSEVFGVQSKPFGRMVEALDSLNPGEVYLSRGGGARCAAWGESMTARAKVRGATGAVIDGYHRDTSKVLAQRRPVISRGACAQDASVRSTVLDLGVTIKLGGARVAPGDIVLADRDGAVLIPQDIELEVLQRARDKAATRVQIERGMSSSAAFKTYGVL